MPSPLHGGLHVQSPFPAGRWVSTTWRQSAGDSARPRVARLLSVGVVSLGVTTPAIRDTTVSGPQKLQIVLSSEGVRAAWADQDQCQPADRTAQGPDGSTPAAARRHGVRAPERHGASQPGDRPGSRPADGAELEDRTAVSYTARRTGAYLASGRGLNEIGTYSARLVLKLSASQRNRCWSACPLVTDIARLPTTAPGGASPLPFCSQDRQGVEALDCAAAPPPSGSQER